MHTLVSHQDSGASSVSKIRVSLNRSQSSYFRVQFTAVGDAAQVIWPGNGTFGSGPWSRADQLWQHSCFEVFAKLGDGTSYLEINLATSGQWAAYRFSDYRSGMLPAEYIKLVAGGWRFRERRTELYAMFEVPIGFAMDDWHLALSAVIEETDGTKSYWALKHPPGPPDFHHPDCFALTLPAPE
jgi:hypothetical protein